MALLEKESTKRILFIGYNFTPELTGIGKYSGEMMHWLAQRGHQCCVITAYPYYPYWAIQEPYRKNRFWYTKEVQSFESGGQLQIIRCPMYVPKNPSGIKRMLLDLSFTISATARMMPLLFQKKFDWVITVAPSFQFGLLGVMYRKLKGAKHLYHIQDLQIEAAQDLGIIRSPRLLRILYGIERYIFRNSDIISSISEGMIARIERKARKPLLFFPNWTETKSFFPISDNNSLKQRFGFASTDWVVLYSGAIGEKQGLEAILYAADALRSYQQIHFVICGTGPYKKILKTAATGMNLENVHFLPLQPIEDFNAFLNMADLHLVIQKEKTSDLVMPSKLTTIFAVGGLALITANSESSLYKIVSRYKMGVLVAPENQQALNEAIVSAYKNLNTKMVKQAARAYAEQYLAIDKIMSSFEKQINR